ncbi:Transcriptional regulator WhiB1 [Corynebacterium bovis DSM 20582 = CIP 54.80]|nr:Transcriptional regulator WhiB1 [Corynebacterium bovis DSM 20582 = CIP 54.80]
MRSVAGSDRPPSADHVSCAGEHHHTRDPPGTTTLHINCTVHQTTTKETITMDWRHKAVCREEDPELFFPVGNSGPALAQIAKAKLVCNRCPVTSQCLNWAIESGQDAGVWGGMSEDERRALKRRTNRGRTRTRATV